MMRISSTLPVVSIVAIVVLPKTTLGFLVPQPTCSARASQLSTFDNLRMRPFTFALLNEKASGEAGSQDGEIEIKSARARTFDQAGASLMDAEDQKRMEEMGDFDALKNKEEYDMRMNAVRNAIRSRTEEMGIEKQSDDYFKELEEEARKRGPPGLARNDQFFGGIDLSQISDGRGRPSSDWDDSQPKFLYDPADEMTEEEMTEADQLGQKKVWEQALFEISNSKWPTFFGAARELVTIFAIIGLFALLILNWDKAVRSFYTSLGFIPSPKDAIEYAGRFDGLDLPKGWSDGMDMTFKTNAGVTVDSILESISDNVADSSVEPVNTMPDL